MKIKHISDGRIETVEDCWGERLIEQGKALPAKAENASVTDEEAKPAAQTETAKKPGEKKR